MTYPQQLPEKPEGWTRILICHFNYGADGGSATYSVFDADGNEMPFVYEYDTRKPPVKGFKLPGNGAILTWAQLRAEWSRWLQGECPTQPTQSIPEGYKLMPIEPTEEMLRAMTDPFIAINGDNRTAFESAYKAMLAAAPKPEAKP